MAHLDDVRPVEQWLDVFRLEDELEYTEMHSEKWKVRPKSDFIQTQIQKLHSKYYQPKYEERIKKSLLKHQKTSSEHSENSDEKSGGSEEADYNYQQTDPIIEMLLTEDFYIGLADEPLSFTKMEDLLNDK